MMSDAMKASELIEQLQQNVEEYGDCDVRIETEWEGLANFIWVHGINESQCIVISTEPR